MNFSQINGTLTNPPARLLLAILLIVISGNLLRFE